MGIEARAQGANYSAAICVNLARHPAWGRNQESYGEDPLVLGAMGAALTIGLRENVMACVKHYALNSMEDMRFEVDVRIDDRTLHEVYLPHFKRCLEEGGAESVMSAYNSVNGEYAGENKALLDGVIREDWNMPHTLLTTDFVWGLRDGPRSVRAGLDIEMPWPAVRTKSVPIALASGSLTWDDISKPAFRVLATQLAHYSRMSGAATPAMDVVGGTAHRALARRVATEGMILLKNDGDARQSLLPLNKQTHRTIAVIGHLAASVQTGDQGSSNVRDRNVVSPLTAFRKDPEVSVIYVDGSDIPSAIVAAEAADAVFILVGYTAKEEGESILCTNLDINRKILPSWASALGAHYAMNVVGTLFGFLGIDTGGDRISLRLRPSDEQLVKAVVAAAGAKTILGIEASAAVLLPLSVRQECASILWTGYGGTEYGNALQDVLWGRSEPSGRLPFIIPESDEDLPVWSADAKIVTYDRWHGYRLLQKKGKKAVYPFGFGLGYSDIRLVPGTLHVSPISSRFFDVEVGVENRGQRVSTAVVQIYGGKADTSERAEIDYERVLIGFSKILVQDGERVSVKIHCRLDPVAHRNSSTRRWELASGRYTVSASRHEGDEDGIEHHVQVNERVIW